MAFSSVLLILIFYRLASALDYVVYPDGAVCRVPPCYTLQHYINSTSHYFTNHSTFLFLPGQHFLNTTLHLNYKENLTLKADESGASIVLSSKGNLACHSTRGIHLIGICIQKDSYNYAIIFENSNTFIISHSIFEVKKGLNLGLSVSQGNISDCSFLYSSVNVVSSIVKFTNTVFHKNDVSIYGSAVYSYKSRIEFHENLSITDNKAAGQAALLAVDSLILVLGLASFINNGPTGAMSLNNSTFEASGELIFIGNQADNGGAIGFDSYSRLILQAPVNVSFINNSAAGFGGALYVEDSDLAYFTACRISQFSDPDQSCFIEFNYKTRSTGDIHIDYQDNTAVAGSLLYGGTLQLCKVRSNGVLLNTTGYQFLKNVSTISNHETISSSPLYLCLCTSNVPDCTKKPVFTKTIPGKKFNVSVAAMGQFNSTPADVGIKIVHRSRDRLVLLNNNSVSVGCNNITFQVLSFLDDKLHRPIWRLYPNGCTPGFIYIYIHLKECPNGFSLVVDTCGCEEGLQDLDNVFCDVQSELIENSGTYWISPSYRNNTYVGFVWYESCPKGFCRTNNKTHPSHVNFSSPDGSNSQCRAHRIGVLCGACEEGFSLAVSSLECTQCANKFLGLLLVFVVAGVGVIVLLLALHMTVATGTINGVILYANILNVHADLFMLNKGNHKFNPLTVVISWLNLDFGIPLCLYDGLDAYQYSWLQYAFPVYLWFLTGCIIISCKYSSSMRKLLGSNPVAVLATVILMSFTKILQTTIDGLAYAQLKTSNGTRLVWLSDGNIEYFENWNHIILATVGICVISFVLVPYTFLLTFGYRLQAYSNRKGFRWFNKLTPLLDAYYAPYNKSTRYWPGLMLLLRIGLFSSYILCADNIMIIISVLFLASITSHLKLYKTFYLDLLEITYILNLCVLCAGTYHVKLHHGNQYTLSCVCVGVALLELCGIMAFHVYNRFNYSLTNFLCVKYILKKYHSTQNQVLEEEVVPVVDHSNSIYREPLLDSGRKTSFPHYSSW